MNGLYALKPWYAARLTGTRRRLVEAEVDPALLSWAGVGLAAAAGAVVARVPAGVGAGVAVSGLLAGRLACANLDGSVARDAGRATSWGAIVNELTDRLADLVVVAALALVAPLWLVAMAAAASTLPSWVSLAGAAAGAQRIQGGPVGKTERAALVAVAAFTGAYVPVLVIVAAGSLLTALARLARLRRTLAGAR